MQRSKLIGCIYSMNQSACAKSFNSLDITSYVNNRQPAPSWVSWLNYIINYFHVLVDITVVYYLFKSRIHKWGFVDEKEIN